MTGIYARWHMFEEKREAVTAIEMAVLPLLPAPVGLAAEIAGSNYPNLRRFAA